MTTMAADGLVEVSAQDWSELRDLYKRDWPRYEVAYNTLQNFIHWTLASEPVDTMTVYSYGESWRQNGTVVITSANYIFLYTLDASEETLRKALLAFKWKRAYISYMTTYRSLLLEVYQTLNLKVVLDVPNVLYRLSREQAQNITYTPPDGFYAQEINPMYAQFINDRWRFKGEGTERVIERLLKHNLSMGLFDAQQHLVGWCLRGENGAMCMLGVSTKRKGYGSLVVKAFAKGLEANGCTSYASVVKTNAPSRAMFEKLGFVQVCDVDWLGNSAHDVVQTYRKQELSWNTVTIAVRCQRPNMQEDRLKPIPRCDWEEWRDLYKRDWPRHELAYNTVQNYINWSKRDRKIKDLVIYSLNGSWRENGTYVIIDRIDLYMYTLDESLVTLRRALELVDWDYYYVAVMCEYETLLFDVFKQLNVQLCVARPNYVYYLSKEQAHALSVTLPEGFKLASLKPENTDTINDHWPHRETGSEFSLERLICWNPSIGLYDSSDNLLGWCLVTQMGIIGSLGVIEKRKGYGRLVLKGIVKKLAEMGLNSYASILANNEPSKALFESVGFKLIKRVNWIRNCERKLVEWKSAGSIAMEK
ncbi:uncharacterized protein LOC128270629 [Anopheles cruzii]|uniref:uncharacterized protein LOC128270629 n=1 Tax=Anopheles cruzii TaxID=68878 RepID=UPI0022EC490B|nr:uncharacterized protein LOC128270629 [Anopheles cruzii]